MGIMEGRQVDARRMWIINSVGIAGIVLLAVGLGLVSWPLSMATVGGLFITCSIWASIR